MDQQHLESVRVQMIAQARQIIAEEKLDGVTENPVGDSHRGKARAVVGIENGVLYVIGTHPIPLALLGDNPIEAGAREIVRWLADPLAQL